ncbi:Pectinesterase protein [Dioscorea alata]|uniref:Pectinesterase protein n=1 Tax=Dioscorea alata TaxID=55571 RepID=A0ACB7UC07_DIOAL|nr:Pectinesterase protein [Dioscorea alata]
MDYGRLDPSDPPAPTPPQSKPNQTRLFKFLLVAISALIFLSVSATLIGVLVRTKANHTNPNSNLNRAPTQAISRTCELTRYPTLCVSSLLDFPGALQAGERDLVHITLNMTFQRVAHALYGASAIAGTNMDALSRAAYDDCMELLDASFDQLSQSLHVVSPTAAAPRLRGASDEDVLTWLSAALTNQDTCNEGLDVVTNKSYVKDQMQGYLRDVAELVSNCLAIFSVASRNQDFSGIPIQNKRRLMGAQTEEFFPEWVKAGDRVLLQVPPSSITADFVVSKDGNGTYKSIADAVKAAPEYSTRRIVIYVKAGTYFENIKVGRKKTNIMFIGDGKGKTIVSGSRSVAQLYTTFHTATFAATGAGFIMRDMTIQNTAGPGEHQAVALRVGADHAVVYHCNIIGYQDTLYVHSQRQFFRECDIYGTVDFICGNAAVVLQNCSLWARKPMQMQKNTITAQNRKDPNQNTGISIHACRIVATSDLAAVHGNYPTYLGRPWKLYSRTVYMMSYIGDHVHPAGWLEWNSTFALNTLYYGEYMNYGPGAAVGKRVTWPGYRVITVAAEAMKFTVGQFISGSSWLPSTGVSFLAGLSL